MMKPGVPIAKMDCFRDLFKENALTLTSVPNMRQQLPFVLRQESDRVKTDICVRPISIVFDGTTHVNGNCSEMGYQAGCL